MVDKLQQIKIAQMILQRNSDAHYFSAYVPNTATGICTVLNEPDIQVLIRPQTITVIDAYNVGPNRIAEIWGPYPLNADASINWASELDTIFHHLSGNPEPRFFIDSQNFLVSALKQLHFSPHLEHIWHMTPLPKSTHIVERFNIAPPKNIAEQVDTLHQQQFNSGPITQDTDCDQPILVCYNDESIVIGYTQGALDADGIGHLLFVAVAPEYRRRGIAEALMGDLYRYLTAIGAKHVELVQADVAEAAGKTYAACGFKRVKSAISFKRT